MRYDLGSRPYRLRSFARPVMRISDDLRKAVVFLGTGDEATFESFGTAFLVAYKRCRYLVTAQHVIHDLGDLPFSIRVNKTDGTSDTIQVDPLTPGEGLSWHAPEGGADVAVAAFNFDFSHSGWDQLLIPNELLVTNDDVLEHNIGIGDVCYTIGLFFVLAGKRRNIPVVHTGNIALTPGEETVPVSDWTKPKGAAPLLEADAYLVETSSLQGLSGAPVFVRPVFDFDMNPIHDVVGRMLQSKVRLLGVWHGSWEGDIHDVVAKGRPTGVRVPVGMGIVTPTAKLLDLLETPDVVAERNAWLKSVGDSLAAEAD